jgi:hypothetical protein
MQIRKLDTKKKAKAEQMLRLGKPMRVVAEAVGVSVPTLYMYFPGGSKGIRTLMAAEAKTASRKTARNTLRKAA